MENFWGTLKNGWVHHQKYKSLAEAKTDFIEYIEGFYNTFRLHSTLGNMSQANFEVACHNPG